MSGTHTLLNSKERLLKATARLLAERGYDGVGLALIAKEAGTTTGSLYFHFPGGKEDLAVAAIDAAAEGRRRRIRETLNVTGPAQIAHLWADHLESSDWKIGCPVAATTLQMSTRSEALRLAGLRAFQLWQQEIERYLADRYPHLSAPQLAAGQMLAVLEGAELLARTSRSRTDLENAARIIDQMLEIFDHAGASAV